MHVLSEIDRVFFIVCHVCLPVSKIDRLGRSRIIFNIKLLFHFVRFAEESRICWLFVYAYFFIRVIFCISSGPPDFSCLEVAEKEEGLLRISTLAKQASSGLFLIAEINGVQAMIFLTTIVPRLLIFFIPFFYHSCFS